MSIFIVLYVIFRVVSDPHGFTKRQKHSFLDQNIHSKLLILQLGLTQIICLLGTTQLRFFIIVQTEEINIKIEDVSLKMTSLMSSQHDSKK